METIKKYRRRLAVIVAAFLIFGCWVGTYMIAGTDQTKTATLAIFAVLTNLAATVIAFLIASVLFSQEDSTESERRNRQVIQEVLAETLLFSKGDADRFEQMLRNIIAESMGSSTTLDQVPWSELIANADEIDFVVQGWDSWGDHASIAPALADFFLRKGKFRMYVCNPVSDGGSHARALLEQRLNRTPGEIVTEIKGTFRRISEIREGVPAVDRGPPIELFETDNLNWYFAALFTGKSLFGGNRVRDVLVLSVYAHTRRRSWDMPAQMVYPDTQSRDFREWFKKELQYLRDGVPKDSTTHAVVFDDKPRKPK